jgi:hypothetical protein
VGASQPNISLIIGPPTAPIATARSIPMGASESYLAEARANLLIQAIKRYLPAGGK